MKKAIVIATIFASAVVCSIMFSGIAVADCGKMMIYQYYWRQTPPSQYPPVYPQRPVRPLDTSNDPDSLPPPAPRSPWGVPDPEIKKGNSDTQSSEIVVRDDDDEDDDDNNIQTIMKGDKLYAFGTFKESGQRAVIAWNGYEDSRGEETLILTTKEKSLAGTRMAMLSVLPLPGAPIAIEQADPEVFNKARKLLYSKLPSDSTKSMGEVVFVRKIGPHNIFVWQLDSVAAFKQEVSAYVASTYGDKAAALIDENTENIVNEYFKRGFRYFAFDLTVVEERASDKIAISYHFKSDHVYFPLQISQVGGSKSKTIVDLIIMTPGSIRPTGVISLDRGNPHNAFITGNQSVPFSMDTVSSIHPELAKVFNKNLNKVYVREVHFEGILNSFNGDFTARNYE